MLMSDAADCRSLISLNWTRSPGLKVAAWFSQKPVSANAIHTAINIALFPLLFFFSGLFYTDVLSTCVVLRMYRLFLERKGAYTNTAESLIWMYPTGIVALTMRQTNIFWVAVFLGGLEAVRTIKRNPTAASDIPPTPHTWQQIIISKFNQYRHGEIHDLPLEAAGVHGILSDPNTDTDVNNT
jgi:alpha-1,2-glucosyltransferase